MPPAHNPIAAVVARTTLADASLNLTDPAALARREPLLREALALAEQFEAAIAGEWAGFALHDLLHATGRAAEAGEALARIDRISGTVAAASSQFVLLVRARAPLAAGDWALARPLLDQVVARGGRRSEDGGVVLAQGLLALVDAATGDADAALATADAAVLAARMWRERQVLVMALVRAVECRLVLGRPGQCRALLDELLALLRELGLRRWVAESLELAAVVLAADDPAAAAHCLSAADALRIAMNEYEAATPQLAQIVDAARAIVAAKAAPDTLTGTHNDSAAMPMEEVLALARTALTGQ